MKKNGINSIGIEANPIACLATRAKTNFEIETLTLRKIIVAVITSPPYPNEKDYSRTTRLESVILGYINTKDDLRRFKKGMLRSNTI